MFSVRFVKRLNWVWVLALAVNITALADRPGDPLDIISLFWLMIITLGPATLFSVVCGIGLLVDRKKITGSQQCLAWVHVASPLIVIAYFWVASYIVKFH